MLRIMVSEVGSKVDSVSREGWRAVRNAFGGGIIGSVSIVGYGGSVLLGLVVVLWVFGGCKRVYFVFGGG